MAKGRKEKEKRGSQKVEVPAPPSPGDFSSRAVNRAVMSEAGQHPATLFPAAVTILSSFYMALMNFSEAAFTLAVGSGLLSVASWVYQYFVRGEKIAAKYVDNLKEKRDFHKHQQVFNIEQECKDAGFSEGEAAARELREAYTRLARFLKDKFQKRQSMSAQRFLVLAGESYDQGMSFLTKALSLYQALDEMDQKKLKKELKAWEREVERLQKKTGNEGNEDEHAQLVIQALDEKIRSHRRRLDLFDERGKTLKQVLAQCEILEATLDSAYLEVVDLLEDRRQVKRESVAGNLERAVTAARKVENRLRGLEKGSAVDDSIYSRQTD